MNITVNINIPGLCDAFFAIASAISGKEITAPTTVTTASTTPAATNKDEQSPTEKKKAEINTQITALGGQPLDSGVSLKKFEAALAAAKEAKSKEATTPAGEEIGEEDGPTLDEVRMLAGYVVKGQADDEKGELGKTKLGAVLEKIGETSITDVFNKQPEKAGELVTLLEKNCDKSLAEAVAWTSAD